VPDLVLENVFDEYGQVNLLRLAQRLEIFLNAVLSGDFVMM
jgi:hypothetical protein